MLCVSKSRSPGKGQILIDNPIRYALRTESISDGIMSLLISRGVEMFAVRFIDQIVGPILSRQ